MNSLLKKVLNSKATTKAREYHVDNLILYKALQYDYSEDSYTEKLLKIRDFLVSSKESSEILYYYECLNHYLGSVVK